MKNGPSPCIRRIARPTERRRNLRTGLHDFWSGEVSVGGSGLGVAVPAGRVKSGMWGTGSGLATFNQRVSTKEKQGPV